MRTLRLPILLILLSVLLSLLSSCTNDDSKEKEAFCGTVIGRGQAWDSDIITIYNGKEQRNFKVSSYNDYPRGSYQCK